MSKISNNKEQQERKVPPTKKGVVISDAMDKTVVVEVVSLKTHPKYLKKIKATKKYHVHDEKNARKVGETVFFEECRPLSKSKRWKIVDERKDDVVAGE